MLTFTRGLSTPTTTSADRQTKMQSNPEDLKGLNILCIDGGGVRGLSSLIILQEIMRRIGAAQGRENIHPYEHFDVIAGTGTGGISACMLGRLRMPIDQAIEKYAKLLEDVFKEKKISGTPMYRATKLQDVLQAMIREATGREMEMMRQDQNDHPCRTMVFAMARHNLNAGLPVIFRSYPVTTNPGPNCTIVETLRATMAHPDLFKGIDIIESSVPQAFIGGDVGCSNPLAHVLSEVERVWPKRQVSCIYSIGAGHTRTIQMPKSSWLHRTQDVLVMKDMATDSERVAEEMSLRFQRTSEVYFRFNVDQGTQDMKDGSWERLGEAMQHAKAYLQKNTTNQRLEEAVRISTKRYNAITTTHAAARAAGQVYGTVKSVVEFKRCPPPTKFYTGRMDENKQVMECITGGSNKRRVCVVHGLGGSGKTELVLNVIEQTRDHWVHIIYVDASSEEAIEKAFKEFGTAKNTGQTSKEVIDWLESCSERWLVVFDNADAPSTNVWRYIPARGHGSVVITTRLPDLARLSEGPDSVCHLSSMSLEDGTALLLKITSPGDQCSPDNDVKAARELVQELGELALAIVHAGAYIAHSLGMTITRYHNLLSSQRRRMLDEYNELPLTAKLDERGDTVYTTWRMCYDQLTPESRKLLWLIAYLHYDGISEEMFKRATVLSRSKKYPLPFTDIESQAQNYVSQYLSTFLDSDGNWDGVRFMRVMSNLTSYSLIDFDRMNFHYHVHVLVHDWAKTIVEGSSELAIECSASLISLSIDHKQDAASLAFKRQLGLHVTSILNQRHKVGENHGYYFEEIYAQTGQWRQRLKVLEPVVEALIRTLGGNHPDTLSSLNNLAMTYPGLGRYDDAEQLLVQVVDARRRLLGDEHSDTLSSMGNLASTYSRLARYDKAQQLQAQVVDAHKRLLGDEHSHTLTSMNNLAWTCSRLGQYDKAEQLQVQVLDAHKRVMGDEHPQTLSSMNNLASKYSDLAQYDKAEQLQVQVLGARKRLLGDEHPDTLSSMNNLASTYSVLGRYDKAEQLQAHVLDARKRLLGDEHPDTITSVNNLALTYSRSGRYDKAEQLQVQVVDAYKRVLGDEHPHTLSSMSNLAMTYSRLGQYDKAEQLQVQVIDARKRLLGDEHPHTLTSMNNLASTYSRLGRHDKAEQLQVLVLDADKRLLGDEHPDTLNSMNNLAMIYSNLDRWDEAGELYQKAVTTAGQILGDRHPDTQLYRKNLLDVHNRMAKTAAPTDSGPFNIPITPYFLILTHSLTFKLC
ncbi:Nephrocystin-3 [Homo sapiens] [Rhizoctonia solani]|uniref:Nephrocystin-3 [Homo sapiens] n=1 Tax=Rhizoctonia solani TaxID=456999 RepID=A0A0K6FZQ9_9AGAM|nr:Nephrocystin-3 [Homo sapiens] [Rhizoctonia solani]